MHLIIVTVKQGGATSFCEKSVWIDICREWDFSYSQCSFLPGSEVAVRHINGKVVFESSNSSKLLKWLFTNETAKKIVDHDDILWNTLKCRRIQACKCQALPNVFHMGAGWPEIIIYKFKIQCNRDLLTTYPIFSVKGGRSILQIIPWKADTNSSFISGNAPAVARIQAGPAGTTTYWVIQLAF